VYQKVFFKNKFSFDQKSLIISVQYFTSRFLTWPKGSTKLIYQDFSGPSMLLITFVMHPENRPQFLGIQKLY